MFYDLHFKVDLSEFYCSRRIQLVGVGTCVAKYFGLHVVNTIIALIDHIDNRYGPSCSVIRQPHWLPIQVVIISISV